MAPLYVGVEPNDPSFVRWNGEGTVSVQFQGGVSVAELRSGEDTRAQLIDPAPAAATDTPPSGWGSSRYTDAERLARWQHMLKHGRPPKPYHMLRLRVASDGRAPVWAAWPIILHRPLPDFLAVRFPEAWDRARAREVVDRFGLRIVAERDGEVVVATEGGGAATLARALVDAGAVSADPRTTAVKWAAVRLKKIGPREEWSVTFTLDVPERRERCGEGAVAVDLGWRRMGGGSLRVATTEDEAGTVRELRLDADLVRGLGKASEIRSIRDMHFDTARAWLHVILDDLPAIPEWLQEATKTMALWKAQGRLASVAIRWRGARFEGDTAAIEALEAWRIKDKHLWCWETSQRTGALRRRKDLYRVFAAGLARAYRTVVLEDFDLRAFARRPAAEETETERDENARAQRHLAATSELRLALVQAFVGRGGEEAREPATDTTRKCSECGVVEIFDAGAELRHTCRNGHAWDQDENACRNLLKRWRERIGGDENRGTARADEKGNDSGQVRESTWARRKREKAARAAEHGIARETASDTAK